MPAQHTAKAPLKHLEFAPEQGLGPYIDNASLLSLEAEPEKLFGTPLQRRGVAGLKYNLLLLQND